MSIARYTISAVQAVEVKEEGKSYPRTEVKSLPTTVTPDTHGVWVTIQDHIEEMDRLAEQLVEKDEYIDSLLHQLETTR